MNDRSLCNQATPFVYLWDQVISLVFLWVLLEAFFNYFLKNTASSRVTAEEMFVVVSLLGGTHRSLVLLFLHQEFLDENERKFSWMKKIIRGKNRYCRIYCR